MADFNKPYNPGMAELGKFVEIIAPSDTSYGKYAILTFDSGGMTSAGDVLGTSANPMYSNLMTVISNVEVSLSGVQMSEFISAVNCTVSTLETNPITSISAIQMGEWNMGTLTNIISTVNVSEVNPATAVEVTNTVTVQENSAIRIIMTKDLTIPNTIWIGSSSLAAGVEYVPSLANELLEIEIQNKTEGPVYFLASATDYIGVESNGITIEPDTFYSTRKYISEFTIGSLSGGDVRVIGHYNNEA